MKTSTCRIALRPRGRLVAGLVALGFGLAVLPAVRAEDSLAVCATTPDVASLLGAIGGERVSLTTFVKPREDPHFAETRPSFVKAMSACELYVQNGLDLEAGWAPLLLQSAKNPGILPGAQGYLDLSRAIEPRDLPQGALDRSMGDVHPLGNPHYLLDPLAGLAAARLVCDRLGELRPAGRPYFEERFAAFRDELFRRLVGDDLARKYGAEVPKLATLFERGKLLDYLRQHGEAQRLGGWLGSMAPHWGAKVVEDHRIWRYFADRFGLRIIGSLEPKPGIPPTTQHLSELIDRMRAENVRVVLASAYYDSRYASLVAEKAGVQVLAMANQVGAVAGADSYLAMLGYDVGVVASALAAAGPP